MGWFTDKLLGIRLILSDGSVPFPERGRLNFIGATVADNDALKSTDVTFPEVLEVAAATELATPDALAKRGEFGQCNFAGACNFVDLDASGGITCASFDASGDGAIAGDVKLCSGTDKNLAFGTASPNFQGGRRIMFIAKATSLPGGDPTDGGYFYVTAAGGLEYHGPLGTVTPLAPP